MNTGQILKKKKNIQKTLFDILQYLHFHSYNNQMGI